MARPLFRALSKTSSVFALLSSITVPVWAEDVVYDGDATMLQDIPNPGGTPDPISNSVAPSGSNIMGQSPNLANNRVTVTNGSGVESVFGAVNTVDSDAVTNNQVLIEGTTMTDVMIMGGWAPTVTGNSVTINRGTVNGRGIFGGYYNLISGSSAATATGNSVAIIDSTVNNGVTAGGYAAVQSGDGTATASNNKVTISGVSVVDQSFGGYAKSDSGAAQASGNSVTTDDNAQVISATGGVAVSNSGIATASGNKVTISGVSIVDRSLGGGAVSSSGSAQASGNNVTIGGDAQVTSSIIGGHAVSDSGTAQASGNSVAISDNAQVTSSIIGGHAVSNSGTAQATNNTVTIGDVSIVTGSVYGGYADSNGAGMSGEANNNKVTISGGTVSGSIYGGYSLVDGHGETGSATGNSVTIGGAPDLSGADFYGGFVGTATTPVPGMDAFSGNTLNVFDYGGSAVQSVQNFQQYNFTFPVTQNTPVLNVTGTAALGDGNGRSSTVTASTLGNTAPLRAGDRVTLIDASAGTLNTTGFTQTQAQGQHSATLNYLWDLDTANNMLTATLSSVQARPQAKVLVEGFLSGLALVNQGADLAAGQGMRDAVLSSQETENGIGIFGALSGGWSEYDTGSHIEMSSISLLTGLSRGVDLIPGRLTVGAFFEYGSGSHDTYNAFSGIDYNGDGDVDHLGGGIIGRLDFAEAGPGHVYTEASFRAGTVSNEYNNANLVDVAGHRAGGYDSDSGYYGLHAGLGYISHLNDTMSLDLYGKYFWTRVQGDDVALATGEPISFDDADSHRMRVGTRFAYAENITYTHYMGVAYEHEFDGEAGATTFGYAIDAPELAGGTGIGEVGMHIVPTNDPSLSLDMGLQAYVGTREGMTGSLQIRYEF
ncbi:MAG: autotransporter outer membrane beta-barrel domain-containing protein [Desulfobulbus sp.]|jgi:hypothetical protein|uniref:autotransporter outer membrane beta-barrel domain-containing protein n=1 Tax=Desulfobulbus sp. TaxID=895 RepID=UPI00284AE95F|nr:autotransporter outer membrane beta-barrel domain-containing protein [Desulfobulbus sp.]MDR2550358.1 autotransporter outer membrane beta-barrel domain-containing protein [Desulfobulbus sp.]